MFLYLGEHRRVKRARNRSKTKKMNPHGKSTRLGLPHTVVPIWQDRSTTYTGKLHACAYSTALTTGVSHERVPAEPKNSPILKRPLLRAIRHSKAYLNT
ncbi:LPS-assembly lptD [Gossypium arboreum]|uniref:LPS-assembly lptD n=1 Tax=Gossypium arboreum TaxID=29729 RepID=A0A0B0N966_GOSAR|nr:LPS-assembly lptD [Gossypium arboreum]